MTINIKSNKTFWHTKPEISKKTPKNVEAINFRPKNHCKQSYCCNVSRSTETIQVIK